MLGSRPSTAAPSAFRRRGVPSTSTPKTQASETRRRTERREPAWRPWVARRNAEAAAKSTHPKPRPPCGQRNRASVEKRHVFTNRSAPRGLLLAFPILDRWPGPREHDVFVLDVLGENLSRVDVL